MLFRGPIPSERPQDRGPSSDYAAQWEIMGDIAKGLRPILADAFAGIPVDVVTREPGPDVPQMCVTVQIQRSWPHDEMPVPLHQRMTDIMKAAKTHIERTYRTTPMNILYLRPPFAEYHGFVIHLVRTAEKPAYPRLVVAKVRWWRPSNFLRRRLGLQPDEE